MKCEECGWESPPDKSPVQSLSMHTLRLHGHPLLISDDEKRIRRRENDRRYKERARQNGRVSFQGFKRVDHFVILEDNFGHLWIAERIR